MHNASNQCARGNQLHSGRPVNTQRLGREKAIATANVDTIWTYFLSAVTISNSNSAPPDNASEITPVPKLEVENVLENKNDLHA